MQDECTVNQTVKYLGRKWTLLIILELYKGENYTRRFTEVKEQLPGITAKVLSARLKELEEEGLVKKMVESGSVPSEASTLTGSGLGLVEVIKEIKRWALRWKIENLACGHRTATIACCELPALTDRALGNHPQQVHRLKRR